MNSGIGSGRRIGVAAVFGVVLGCSPAQGVAADGGPMSATLRREGIRWPGEGGSRIKVSIGLYLVDFARINLREESFDMAGYLDTAWTDPTIALQAEERKRPARPGSRR